MVLLKHGNFEFKNILRAGYNILEDEPDIIKEVIMANGTKKRNYREMPKTTIKIKFGELNKETYTSYMSHFQLPEDVYTYFSPKKQTLLTKKFFVTLSENSILHASDNKQRYEEFEVILEQCGEA